MNRYISTGINQFDNLLGRGLLTGAITHLYGGSGGGKTTLCLQSAIECIKSGYFCVFISAKRFSRERFKQIISSKRNIAKDLLVFEAKNFEDQIKAVSKINKEVKEEKNLGLVIIDGLTHYYNPKSVIEEKRIKLKEKLANQLIYLLGKGRKNNYSVLVSNQVYEDIETGELRPKGGKLILDISEKNIELKKVKQNKRLAILRDKDLSPIDSVPLRVTKSGLH